MNFKPMTVAELKAYIEEHAKDEDIVDVFVPFLPMGTGAHHLPAVDIGMGERVYDDGRVEGHLMIASPPVPPVVAPAVEEPKHSRLCPHPQAVCTCGAGFRD